MKTVNAKLFTNRATAHFQLGEYCCLLCLICATFSLLSQKLTRMLTCFTSQLAGNFKEALSDAEAGRKFQPKYIKAIERGNL